MRLNYNALLSVVDGKPWILMSGHQRVELFIKDNQDGSHTLIALTGIIATGVEKCLRQGPYTHREQAVGAIRAIIDSLQRLGFTLCSDQQPQWELQAHREALQIRTQKRKNPGNYSFDPKDVLADPW